MRNTLHGLLIKASKNVSSTENVMPHKETNPYPANSLVAGNPTERENPVKILPRFWLQEILPFIQSGSCQVLCSSRARILPRLWSSEIPRKRGSDQEILPMAKKLGQIHGGNICKVTTTITAPPLPLLGIIRIMMAAISKEGKTTISGDTVVYMIGPPGAIKTKINSHMCNVH